MPSRTQWELAKIMLRMKKSADTPKKGRLSAVSRRANSVVKHNMSENGRCVFLLEWNPADVLKPEHQFEWVSLDDRLIHNISVAKAIKRYWKLEKFQSIRIFIFLFLVKSLLLRSFLRKHVHPGDTFRLPPWPSLSITNDSSCVPKPLNCRNRFVINEILLHSSWSIEHLRGCKLYNVLKWRQDTSFRRPYIRTQLYRSDLGLFRSSSFIHSFITIVVDNNQSKNSEWNVRKAPSSPKRVRHAVTTIAFSLYFDWNSKTFWRWHGWCDHRRLCLKR